MSTFTYQFLARQVQDELDIHTRLLHRAESNLNLLGLKAHSLTTRLNRAQMNSQYSFTSQLALKLQQTLCTHLLYAQFWQFKADVIEELTAEVNNLRQLISERLEAN